ncbi:MAG: hypothetical protein JWN83_1292 [Chitinophagaceae bacterium]|nr:hypothetical protein [Ferruginibacter sp.]MDB5222625.1 hypothetical protein [Chitinophagaceae bacterium]
MDYSKIISVTGLSGLYELVASKADGAVVRSLEDKSTKFVSSRVHNFSHLESIEIYTVKDNTVLAEVFKEIKNSKEPLPDAKADGKALKNYFEKVFPDLDFERVYASDMKKIISWYGILSKNNIDIKQPVEEENTNSESVIEEIKDEKPVPEKKSLKNSK